MQTIILLAWGSAIIIIPLKIYFLLRFIRKKMATDEIRAAKKAADKTVKQIES
ncbi:MAG: hypothetical protein HQL69_12760 [Magnetococcales bacterium]|nr:hypothetical protein [Magnetococcales bacterium]